MKPEREREREALLARAHNAWVAGGETEHSPPPFPPLLSLAHATGMCIRIQGDPELRS